MRIALDAMGGDNAPAAPVEGARLALERFPDVELVLITADRRPSLALPSLVIVDKRDLSPEWLADFWRRHSHRKTA